MAAVFRVDLKNTSRCIFDPQDPVLVRPNHAFLISCIVDIAAATAGVVTSDLPPRCDGRDEDLGQAAVRADQVSPLPLVQ